MKKFARALCMMLSVLLGVACFSIFTACPKTGPGPKNEALIMSVQELDNLFNPFFSSSAYDNEIINMTQVGMISTDINGQVYCGPDEPSVALDYSQIISYRENANEDFVEYDPNDSDKAKQQPDLKGKDPTTIDASNYFTTYRFLIKNNIKFSDGEPLTIKDVIFNLYAYLDPTYYGSSTVYSTPIKGLMKYRTQEEEADDDTQSSFNRLMNTAATNRLAAIRNTYSADKKTRDDNREKFDKADGAAAKASMLKDVETVRNLFWNEINDDWKAAEASLEDYDEQYGFTEAWEIFLYNEQVITVDLKSDGKIDTYTEDGKGTDKYGNPTKAGDKAIDYAGTHNWWHDKDSLIKIVFNNKMSIFTNEADNGNYFEYIDGVKQTEKPKTDLICDEQGRATGSTLAEAANYPDLLYSYETTCGRNIAEIVTYWATATTAREQFLAEAKENYFKENGAEISTVDGIKVQKLTRGDTFTGRNGVHEIEDDQYVLEIQIDRVDPKAIWNFGFTVTPMHYYSNGANDTTGKFNDPTVDYRSFNYPVYDSNGELLDRDGDIWNGDDSTISVGRPFASKDYFDRVVKASNIISVPVGAGMYRAASNDLTVDQEYRRPTFSQFSRDNIVYFIYNPYYYTTSGEKGVTSETSSICNCKIKYVRYQVITSTKLLDSIIQGTVHYGDPSSTIENMKKISETPSVTSDLVDNNGYGYIGINAKYVPDIEVRRAIMHAININLMTTYYGGYAEPIYRSMSTASWASPQNPSNPHNTEDKYNKSYYAYDPTGNKSEELVQSVNKGGHSYYKNNGVWERVLDDGSIHKLKYTFTIAGASDDHPAYNAMKNAADILNGKGFDISVKTDSQALSKLASGGLTVWAAAWGSATDPDMYQVYHMDSAATSVKNWGYPSILDGETSATYRDQYAIVEKLSEVIDRARTKLNNEDRVDDYAIALDYIMELAVELPTYQRQNLYAYRNDVIDANTLNVDTSAFYGPLARFWEVDLIR